MTAATATITPRWDTTLAGLRRSGLRGDMVPRVRDRDARTLGTVTCMSRTGPPYGVAARPPGIVRTD